MRFLCGESRFFGTYGPIDYRQQNVEYKRQRVYLDHAENSAEWRGIDMKYILGSIAIILALCFMGFLLPAIAGIVIGIGMIKSGSIIGGLIAIVVGIGINIAMLYGSAAESGMSTGSGHHMSYTDEECPYCASGDTDGNHCYNCDDDF